MANIVVNIDTSHPDHCTISLGSPKDVGGDEKLAVSKMVEALGKASKQGDLPRILKLDTVDPD